jgi:plasmid maintenance system killer protein
MKICFKHQRLERDCNNLRRLQKRFGQEIAKRIRRRLDDLRAADNLAIMATLPGRCHELRGTREGHLSMDLGHPLRLVFTIANNPIARKPDGGLDWAKVTAIEIVGVEDTHE